MPAPSTAVKMPSGVSMRAMVRASVSTSSMKEAPSSMAAGSSRAKFGPTIMRAMCGIIRPIQPITPEIATTLAVISVAAPITSRRSRGTSTPSARASSSPSDSTPMRQRNNTSGTSPISTSGATSARSDSFTPARLPSSQNVIAGSWSYGSARIFTSEMQAPASAPITTPESTSTSVRSWPRSAAAIR